MDGLVNLLHEILHCAILVPVAACAAGGCHCHYDAVIKRLDEAQTPLVRQPEQYEYPAVVQLGKNGETHEHLLGEGPGIASRTTLALRVIVYDAKYEAGIARLCQVAQAMKILDIVVIHERGRAQHARSQLAKHSPKVPIW